MNGETWKACCRLGACCGRDFLWTQGGGGNVSCIDASGGAPVLRIKRSGLRLRDLAVPGDLVPLPLGAVRDLFFSGVPDADDRLEALAPAGFGAPSVEAFFHALLGPWTAHAHLVSATALASIGGDPTSLVARVGAQLGGFCEWVPYAPPGSALAREVHARLGGPAPAQGALLLRNHGAIVWGPSPEAVLTRFEELDAICRRLLGVLPSGSGLGRLEVGAFDPEGTVLGTGPWEPEAAAALAGAWTPDAALHYGHGVWAAPGDLPALGRLFLENGRFRYACKKPGVLENAQEIIEAQLTAHFWTGGRQAMLAPEQVEVLLRWGAGKYGTAK